MKYINEFINFAQSNDWTWGAALVIGFLLYILGVYWLSRKKEREEKDAVGRIAEYDKKQQQVFFVPDHRHSGLRRR